MTRHPSDLPKGLLLKDTAKIKPGHAFFIYQLKGYKPRIALAYRADEHMILFERWYKSTDGHIWLTHIYLPVP